MNIFSSQINRRMMECSYLLQAHAPQKSLVGQQMLATDSDILLIGGYFGDKQELNTNKSFKENQHNTILEVSRFNFASGHWTNILTEGIPSTRIWSSVHLHGRQLFIYGGTGFPIGQMLSNNLKVLDLDSLDIFDGPFVREKLQKGITTWSLIETNASDYNCLDSGDNAPPRGYRQNMIFHKGSIFVYGGVTKDEYIADLHKLNFNTISWEKLAPMGEPPCQPAQFLGKDEER